MAYHAQAIAYLYRFKLVVTAPLRKIMLQLLLLAFVVANTQAAVHAVEHHWQLEADRAHAGQVDDGRWHKHTEQDSGDSSHSFDCGLCQLSLASALAASPPSHTLSAAPHAQALVPLERFCRAAHRLRPPSRAPPLAHLI